MELEKICHHIWRYMYGKELDKKNKKRIYKINKTLSIIKNLKNITSNGDIMVTKRTPKELYKKSKELYWNIRNIGKNGQSSKWAYYYCKCILNGKKDVPRTFSQADATNINGKAINVKLTKKQYLQKMKEYCAYIEKHKKLPNHVTILGKYKIKPAIWNAYCGYIFKVYYETGKLLESEPIKSDIYKIKGQEKQETSKIYDYLTNEGCSGMGQCTGYFCACNALQECLYRVTGIHVSEYDIADWAGTTDDGTDHEGINTAVAQFNRKYGKNVKISWYNFSELNWDKILNFIKNGAVFFHLLYRDQWGHYEPIKWVSDDLEILNSLGDGCGSGTYCGYIEYRGKGTQQRYINGISQKSVAVLKNG